MDSQFSLLVKYISHPLSITEKKELDEWRTRSEENQQLFAEASRLRLLNEYEQHNSLKEAVAAFSNIQTKIRRRKTQHRFMNFLKYAATVAILVSLTVVGWTRLNAEKCTTITVAANESIKKIQLTDGSTIWLAASSELRIPHSFSAKNRNVALEGKAFFDIAKNPHAPFFVSSPYINVKVTGTSFDLTVLDKGKYVETILASGKIMLQNKHKENIFEMSPGEKIVYNAEKDKYVISNVDVNTLTSWHLDQITFENATLREIVNKLSLIYDININLESKKLADRRYRYVINREETLQEVLDILSYLAPIHYRIEDSEVFITG